MIETRGLTHRYGQLTAVENLDLKVDEGELFGFIGPNGAGKTTTIQILATLLQPTSGTAWVNGCDVTYEGREVRRAIGFMPDFFGLYHNLRVWEYLEFFAAIYDLNGDRRRSIVGDVLELTDLAAKREAVVGELSRGMQQRLGLARVLVHDPKVLLLDEPASGLDPRARLEVREILRELRAMGKTILLSSHILSELAEVCTSIGILHGGRMIASGSVSEVLAQVGVGRAARLRVDAKATDAVTTLSELDGVEKVQSVGDDDVHPAEVRVSLRPELELPEVAAFAVARGLRLLHLEEDRVDLEEAYLLLTDSDDAEGPTA